MRGLRRVGRLALWASCTSGGFKSGQRQRGLRRACRPASGFTHWSERKSMMRGGPMRAQGGEMFGRGVTFMLCEPVERLNPVPLNHPPVAFYFGDDRGCRNRNGTRITVNERFLLDQDVELHGVEKQIIRRDFQPARSFGHGLAAGLIDIPGIDAARI